MKSEDRATEFNQMPVTGDCDAGCGKPATQWFGDTACATCGDSACVNVIQDSYDREGERPAGVRLRGALATAQNRLRVLQAALLENHRWHQLYDEHGGYPGSALEQTNVAALSLSYGEGLDQADWHEGSTETGRTQHDYLYMRWPPTDKQIRHFLVGPLRFDPELFISSATKDPAMPTLTDLLNPEPSPMHRALLDQFDHLVDHLLPLCSADGAGFVVTNALLTVTTLLQQQLITAAEAKAMTDRVGEAFLAHNPRHRGLFDDQPSEP